MYFHVCGGIPALAHLVANVCLKEYSVIFIGGVSNFSFLSLFLPPRSHTAVFLIILENADCKADILGSPTDVLKTYLLFLGILLKETLAFSVIGIFLAALIVLPSDLSNAVMPPLTYILVSEILLHCKANASYELQELRGIENSIYI